MTEAEDLYKCIIDAGVEARIVYHVGEVVVETMQAVSEPARVKILRHMKARGLDREDAFTDSVSYPRPFEIRYKGPTWTQWAFRYLTRGKHAK